MNETQQTALLHLRDNGALPDSGYWRPLWSMQYEPFDGRSLTALVKHGLVTRIEASDDRSAYQLTAKGYQVAESLAESQR
jgi:hypothetical protein